LQYRQQWCEGHPDALNSPDCSVATLDLANNTIGVDGAIAIENMLKNNSTVLSIDLSGNKNIVGSQQLAPLLREGFNFPNFSLDRV
jgi:hypothetical protein